MFEVSQNGGTCFDPLFYKYADDPNTYDQYEHTFMVANAIKVSPSLQAGNDAYKSYFPKGDWVSLNHYETIVISSSDKEGKYGEWFDLYPSNESCTAHLAPGAMVGWSIN